MLSSLSRPALGEIWSSAMGGGLGSLGELDGEAIGCFQSALVCSEEKERPSSCSREGKHAVEIVTVFVQTHVGRDKSTPQHSRSAPSDPSARVIPRHLFHLPFCPDSECPTIPIMDPNMDFDDDGPPMLVAADQPNDTEDLSADVDDMNLTRVPITIITGM